MSLTVRSPGLLSSVQDGGRFGWRHLGVGCSGAADALSLRIANALVGNISDRARRTAALELTLRGPVLHFHCDALVAVTGARIDAQIDAMPIPLWQCIHVNSGSTLTLGPCLDGARSYLAVRGGIDVPLLLGSRATDLRSGFGGLQGRPLRAGDLLPLHAEAGRSLPRARSQRRVSPRLIENLFQPRPLHVLPSADTPKDLFETRWTVNARSNRQGLIIDGPTLATQNAGSRLSAPVLPGSIQLPPDGQPIVLGVDAQTVGGYPLIGQVISADLHRLGQLRPGQSLRFEAVSLAAAEHARRRQNAALARLTLALAADD